MAVSSKPKRGVAPIISLLMLVVVIVAASIVISAVTQLWLSTQRNEYIKTLRERVAIEDVYFWIDGQNQLATIYLWNYGEVDIKILYCSVDDAFYVTSPSELTLAPGEGGSINITIPWRPDVTYKVLVKTEKGGLSHTYETA